MSEVFRSVSHVGRASLRALIVVALLLVGQFFTISHAADHDSGQSDCVVCRISKPYKQAVSPPIAVDRAALAGSIDGLFVQTPPRLKPITCDTERERAPPTPS
jgi:hypothetical protein